jgi:hypothetical protein
MALAEQQPSLLNCLMEPFKLGPNDLKMESPFANFASFQANE